MDWIMNPWPWYVAGPMIALIMFILMWLGKRFGVSTNLETACSLAGAGKRFHYFHRDWHREKWNLMFAIGSIAVTRPKLSLPKTRNSW